MIQLSYLLTCVAHATRRRALRCEEHIFRQSFPRYQDAVRKQARKQKSRLETILVHGNSSGLLLIPEHQDYRHLLSFPPRVAGSRD